MLYIYILVSLSVKDDVSRKGIMHAVINYLISRGYGSHVGTDTQDLWSLSTTDVWSCRCRHQYCNLYSFHCCLVCIYTAHQKRNIQIHDEGRVFDRASNRSFFSLCKAVSLETFGDSNLHWAVRIALLTSLLNSITWVATVHSSLGIWLVWMRFFSVLDMTSRVAMSFWVAT